MALDELLAGLYAWAAVQAQWLLIAALAIPAVGSMAAWIGKGGRTDRDGRVIASLLVGFGMTLNYR